MATLLREAALDPVTQSGSASDLEAIRQRFAALSIWQRHLPPRLAAALAEVDRDGIEDLEFTIALPDMAEKLPIILAEAGYGGIAAGPLASDIDDLARRFGALVGSQRFKLRFGIVDTDACSRFHADYVTYRLLTTYWGQATQWIRTEEPDSIAQMHTGDVGIFKGRLLAEEPPILHRSPPIAGTGEQRLLLVIDPVIAD